MRKLSEYSNYIVAGVFILGIVALSFVIDIETLKEWVKEAGIWAPLLFILLKISTIVIAPLSGSPLYPLSGLLFGFWPGLMLIAIGDFLGYTITFMISRILGQKAVMRFIAHNEQNTLSQIVEFISSTKGFFIACITFFSAPELLSYGAGLSRLPYWKFILIMLPESLLLSSVLVFLGASLDLSNKSLLLSLIAPVASAVFLVAVGKYFVYRQKKMESGTQSSST